MKTKTKKLINSFKYAFAGIVTSFRTEQNMKIHILVMILVIIVKNMNIVEVDVDIGAL